MKYSIILFLSLYSFICSAQSDPKHVISHNRTTITTNPQKGENPYAAWAIFPAKDEQIRKIMMHVTLGTPDSLPTAHWDYKDHIKIRRTGNEEGEDLNLEIGRMLTPYGSIYSKGWDFTWSIDVTDFAMVLRDSIEIEYNHTGYEPTSVGWALTIDFEITAGPPHIIPLSIQPMWNGNYHYGDPENPIEEAIKPIVYKIEEGSKINRFRIQHTGHGMDRPKGCSEFCSRWRMIKFDNVVVQQKDLWKNCGNNPLYPQGGTWIFDRALWCPGDLQQPDIINIYPSKEKHEFSMKMEPYTATENIQAKENITSCLIQYSAPVNKNDVAIEEIITPNNRPIYNRSNPKSFNSLIKIRNLGSENLKTLTITYGTKGFKMKKYKWKGDLPYYSSEKILLPGTILFEDTQNTFMVECSKPNGKRDAWRGDNVLSSSFDKTKELPEDLVIQFKTNFRPEENNVFIINNAGDTIFHKKDLELKADTIYTDTLHLPKGQYELSLTDSAGTGLEFWFMSKQGYGFLRLLDLEGKLIHLFEKDCGDGEMLAFNTSPSYTTDTCNTLYDFIVYPKMTTGQFSLDTYTEKQESMEVILMSNGVPVEKHFYANAVNGKYNYDISHLDKGRYIIEILMDGVRTYKTRINKIDKKSDW